MKEADGWRIAPWYGCNLSAFLSTLQLHEVVQTVRKFLSVVRADALLGTPDAIAIVECDDLAAMDAVIDKIVEVPEVISTDSKIARWIE